MKNSFMLTTSICLGLCFVMMSVSRKESLPLQNKTQQQASIERGKKVYFDRCLTCHQADGGGVQNMNPPLIKTKWVLGDKTTLVQVLLKGLNTGVEIDGNIYHNVMPALLDLTDAQIADVLTYVRNSFGNKAKAITAAEVKAIRAKTK